MLGACSGDPVNRAGHFPNMNVEFKEHFDTKGFTDEGAAATAENLSQWRPRKGDGGRWPPTAEIIAGMTARWEAVLRAFLLMSENGLEVQTAKVLETGSGYGDGLRPFLLSGFKPQNLYGVDLMPARLEIARTSLPASNLMHGNAGNLRELFDDGQFDVVTEQFCFCHVPDEELKRAMASEMLRVVRPGGFILIQDWRMSAPSRGIYGVSQAYIKELFGVGRESEVLRVFPSHLWPPIGNRVSRYVPALYPLLRLAPFMTGSKVTLLQRQ